MFDPLVLTDWRRRAAELYARVRSASDHAAACAAFRAGRDGLFRTHAGSPLDAAGRAGFTGLAYYAHDVRWRVLADVVLVGERESSTMDLGADGVMRYTEVGRAHGVTPAGDFRLTLFWIEGYGGGLFVPFRDATSGTDTFGGGRYLLDTIKGADLGVVGDRLVLDFNYAYHPSCVYSERWVCPLAPRENTLEFSVRAGERLPG